VKPIYTIALIVGPVLIANFATAQGPDFQDNPWSRTVDFITPFELTLTVPNNDRRRIEACRGVPRTQCPQLLISGGNGQGGLPTLDPVLTASAPHVRVSFVLQRFQVVGAAAAHLEPNELTLDAWWETHSSVADQEFGESHLYFDGSQQVDDAGYFFTPPVIYDALILNACAGFSSFPVSHKADFDDATITIPFEGFDDTTIKSTGFYNFNYTVAVDGDEVPPAESGLHMSGKVNVTCTSVDTL